MKLHAGVFTFVLILTGLQLKGQDFIDTNSVWYATRMFTDYNGDPRSITVSYEFSGTEIIDSKIYHKLFITTSDSIGTVVAISETGKYFRASGSRVYFKLEADGPEYLLHDFDVSTGDTLYVGQLDEKIEVINVDSVELNNGDIRKRVTVEVNFDWIGRIEYSWIEGIGGTLGPMNSTSPITYFYRLQCTMRGDTIEYSEGECQLTTTDNPIDVAEEYIYPNPVTRILNITSESNHGPTDVTIYSLAGRVVYHTRGVFGGKIDLSHLSAGIYLLQTGYTDKPSNVHTLVKL